MNEEKKDYGKTLNLPKTEFSMRANLPENEPKTLEKFYQKDVYAKCLEKNKNNEPYVLHDGPPYANGNIHMGHALNKVLKDIVVKNKTMQGYYSPFVPGFDTHGLPTEIRAIKELGLNRDEMKVGEFRDVCKKFAKDFIDKQIEQFKRLGIMGDWENPYMTLDPKFEAEQIGIFGAMYKKGYIYKGLKPVYWCTDCETALAEAEIEYADDKTTSIYVKFKVEDDKTKFANITKPVYFVIWTTTTWTLPGNTGITVSSDFDYSLVDVGNEVYVIATELVDTIMSKANIEDYKIIAEYKGEDFEGILCKHPFLDRQSRVVLGSEDTIDVKLDTGTGAVHTAPGYGHEDYWCGVKNGLDIIVTVDAKGYQTEEAGEFAGIFYEKSNQVILKKLEETNYLLAKEDIAHQYPHCWRCKKPVIFRATNQWFASVDDFKDEVIEEIKKVKWYPTWGEDRITSMVKERADWCISRQRTWGVPIPIFFCKECGKEYVTDESIKKVQDIFREKGSNAWFDLDVKELIPEGAKCSCGHTEFDKETDIMDVWFDSGSTHTAVCEQREDLIFPANLYLEGADQYRGWFQSSILTSVAAKGVAPYKEVLTHGWTVDGEGRKMSKSLGNGIEPLEIIKEYGSDILRLWVISSDFHSDMRISKDILKQIAEVYRKIRNTARYMLGNLSDFNPNTDMVEYEDLQEIDKVALLKLSNLTKAVNEAYNNFEYHTIYHLLNKFCVIEMSNFYLDIIKDRLYTLKQDSIERRAAQTAMYEILDTLVRIVAPVISFTAEEIWEHMPHREGDNKESIILNEWPKVNEKYFNTELEEKWNKIALLKEDVAKALELARNNKVIGHSLNAKVVLYAEDKQYEFLKSIEDLLQMVFIVSQVEIIQGKSETEVVECENTPKVYVKVETASGEKCERCWMFSETVGDDKENPTICHRCSESLK